MKLFASTGRTIKQGEQLYFKDQPEYTDETSCCFMNPFDIIELAVEPGEHVNISSETGETVFRVISHDGMPAGMVFIPCGPHANFILHSITHGTGAPDYKWIDVEVTPCEGKEPSLVIASGSGSSATKGCE